MRAFKTGYMNRKNVLKQPILVFDESQRAWDPTQMKKSYSEIEGLMQVCDTAYLENGYTVLFCLFGSGQVIYKGEEKNITLWDETIASNNKEWDFYFSPNLSKELYATTYVKQEKLLHLDTSIRNNFIDTSVWIESIICRSSCNLDNQKTELNQILDKNYRIRITRDFTRIINVMPYLKKAQTYSKFGLLVSSRIEKNELLKYTNGHVKTSYIDEKDAGKWFLYDCEKMTSTASEFTIQGLEIEWPIVMFGGDFYLNNNGWEIDRKTFDGYTKQFDDFGQIMENAYRVLLSRGRRGMILFIPMDKKLDETYIRFKDMGISDL